MKAITDIVIKSGQGDYRVNFFTTLEELSSELDQSQGKYFFLVDDRIEKLHPKLTSILNRQNVMRLVSNEKTKTIDGVKKISEWLVKSGADRKSKLVGIGGGVIQDVTTFTASIYHRGLQWIYVPTTLLSQSDSCIGAKCGINLGEYKNQLGVIYSPSAVFICQEFLTTLDQEMIRSGIGEMIKLSLTGGSNFYAGFEDYLLDKPRISSAQISPFVAQSLFAKKEIIELDEYEYDLRRILNYGHTFGHALEAITSNKIDHGTAVVFGMDLINYLGMKWGMTPAALSNRIRKLLELSGYAINVPIKVSAQDFISKIKHDKKTAEGIVNFAVLHEIGDLRIVPRKIDKKLEREIEEYLNEHSLFTFA